MSGGEQQMLAIGRALMARPQLLMLDEPSMGIAPILVQRIYETIGEINRGGVAILLVEQNANYALEVSRRGYVLETGRVVLAGDSGNLRDDPEVQKGVPGDMISRCDDRRQGAVFPVRLAAVDRGRVVAVGAQGLRRAAGSDVRADPVGARAADRFAAAGAAGVEVEARGPDPTALPAPRAVAPGPQELRGGRGAAHCRLTPRGGPRRARAPVLRGRRPRTARHPSGSR